MRVSVGRVAGLRVNMNVAHSRSASDTRTDGRALSAARQRADRRRR